MHFYGKFLHLPVVCKLSCFFFYFVKLVISQIINKMAATYQQSRNLATVSQQSFVNMKRLIATAVSNIVYIRALVPETEFRDRYFHDLPLKILSNKSGPSSAASRIIEWLNGAFEAIGQLYLQELRFMVLKDAEDIGSLIEDYIFSFDYPNGEIASTLSINKDSENSKHIKMSSTQNTLQAAKNFMKHLELISRSLDSLPNQVFMTLRLKFNENAPHNYNPAGYEEALGEENINPAADLEEIIVGDVAYSHHAVRLIVRTEKNSPVLNKKPKEMMSEPMESENIEIVNTGLKTNDDDIRCPCGYTDDINRVPGIRCHICSYWQHSICFCFESTEKCPYYHVCNLCANVKDISKIPSDFSMLTMNSEEIVFMCTYRRALLIAMEVDKLSVLTLAKLLNCKKVLAKQIMDYFQERELFRPCRGAKRSKDINKEKLAEVFFQDIQDVAAINKKRRQEIIASSSHIVLSGSGIDAEADDETPQKTDSMICDNLKADKSSVHRQLIEICDTQSQDQFRPKRKRAVKVKPIKSIKRRK